jgi:hypothetical protein
MGIFRISDFFIDIAAHKQATGTERTANQAVVFVAPDKMRASSPEPVQIVLISMSHIGTTGIDITANRNLCQKVSICVEDNAVYVLKKISLWGLTSSFSCELIILEV